MSAITLNYTTIEELATTTLQRLNVEHPYQLNIESICTRENIDYMKGRTSVFANFNNYKMISINKNKDYKQQHYEFLHEYSHFILRHHEEQTLPESVKELEARRLALCLAIPHTMFHFLDFSSENLLFEMSDLFDTPLNICMDRCDLIQSNVVYYPFFSETKNIRSERRTI